MCESFVWHVSYTQHQYGAVCENLRNLFLTVIAVVSSREFLVPENDTTVRAGLYKIE